MFTKAWSAALLNAIGDIISQVFIEKHPFSKVDWKRLGIFTFLVWLPCMPGSSVCLCQLLCGRHAFIAALEQVNLLRACLEVELLKGDILTANGDADTCACDHQQNSKLLNPQAEGRADQSRVLLVAQSHVYRQQKLL